MARIKNLTQDALGWDGIQIPPGGIVEVSEGQADRMVESNPRTFSRVADLEDTRANRMVDTRAPVHRHAWRKNRTCQCGAVRPR